MITLKDFMETVDYRITEGSAYGWDCYGHDAYCLDSWNQEQDGHTVSIIFDTKTQIVYEACAYDYSRNRAYRLIHPDFKQLHNDEAKDRGVDQWEAWDEVKFVDLETEEDFLEKTRAIVAKEDYDDRVSVPLTLDDDQLFDLMKLAHERDITLNQLVEDVLRTAIEQYETVHVTNTDNPIDFPKPKKKKKGK